MQPAASYILGGIAGMATSVCTSIIGNSIIRNAFPDCKKTNKLAFGNSTGAAINVVISWFIEENSPFWKGFSYGMPMGTFFLSKDLGTILCIHALAKTDADLVASPEFNAALKKKTLVDRLALLGSTCLIGTLKHLSIPPTPFTAFLGPFYGIAKAYDAQDMAKRHLKAE
jgi:hypothetical protein